MRPFTAEQIQNKFEQLPEELQTAIASPEIHEALEQIANKHSLHVDQLGELVDMVGLVMLNLMPSNQFVKNFSAETGIDTKTAMAIATDINTEIFGKIKTSMQVAEGDTESTGEFVPAKPEIPAEDAQQRSVSALEKAGGFDIEQDKTASVIEPVVENKKEILDGIENPAPSPHTETLVDRLLNAPAGVPEQKITQATPIPKPPQAVPQPPTAPKRPSGPDPYREPVI